MAPRLREGAARLSGRRGGAAAHLPAPVGSVGPARAAQPGAAGERGRSRLPRPQLQAGSVGLTGSQRPPEAAASPRRLSPPCARPRACAGAALGEAREGGVDAGTRRPQRRAEAPAGRGGGARWSPGRPPGSWQLDPARPPLRGGPSPVKPQPGTAPSVPSL